MNHRPFYTWEFWEKLNMSPEHEKLFSFLCVIERAVPNARRQNPDQLLLTIGRIYNAADLLMCDLKVDAKVSLRVRCAMDYIVDATGSLNSQMDVYRTIERVQRAAVWGSGKSKLLTSVTDQTWREQCAGRANLALRRDFPELIDN